jgi:hypothetical protein
MGTLFSITRSQLVELPLVTTAPPRIMRSPDFRVIFKAMNELGWCAIRLPEEWKQFACQDRV